MNTPGRFARLCVIPTLCIFLVDATLPAVAKDDWQSGLHKWAVSSDSNPNCTVRYTVGVYRPDMGDKPAWGLMTEQMFKWFSKDGAKLAPSVCTASRATQDKAEYRILFSVSPMKTVSQTTHGSEVRTTSEPFSASITSQTTYSDGSTANGMATVNGEQTSTVVVPTETTVSRSSVAEYMYAYRVKGNQLELIGSDNVVFSRVAASGSGDNATGAELGSGIGNLVRMSGDRHRADKLYEEALKAISADAQDNSSKQAVPTENQASGATPSSPPERGAPSPLSALAQASPNIESIPSAQSIATLKEQAASGDAKAQSDLGGMYYDGNGIAQDLIQAAIWYRKAADQGVATAQFNLGLMYASGKGVPQDESETARWYHKAAEQGLAVAQFSLGALYYFGNGVPQNLAQAVAWYRKAAEQGNADAQFSLGALYYDGNAGFPQDSAQAAVWYRKAAEQGNADAQAELGGLYSSGRGVKKDEAQAAIWLRKAAEQSDAKAQFELGADYASGEGVPQDYAEAYFWLDLAAAGKIARIRPEDSAAAREGTAKLRDLVASHLAPADLSREQERARKWFEDHPTKPQ